MREKNSAMVQVRLPASMVEQLDKFAWSRNRSDAIRIIQEAFCSMTVEEQSEFLKKFAERKFSLN